MVDPKKGGRGSTKTKKSALEMRKQTQFEITLFQNEKDLMRRSFTIRIDDAFQNAQTNCLLNRFKRNSKKFELMQQELRYHKLALFNERRTEAILRIASNHTAGKTNYVTLQPMRNMNLLGGKLLYVRQ
ncbi:hypothetical protein HHI36_008176, partial [Cryptolaemus montrouzieri]